MTLDVLERVASECSSKHPDTASLLQLLNSMTNCLLYSGDYGGYDTLIASCTNCTLGKVSERFELRRFPRTQAEEYGLRECYDGKRRSGVSRCLVVSHTPRELSPAGLSRPVWLFRQVMGQGPLGGMPIWPAPGTAPGALEAPKPACITAKRHGLGINARRAIIFLIAK